jgi:hypothetical protein
MQKQFSAQWKWGTGLIHRWAQDTGIGAWVYRYSIKKKLGFSPGQYTTVFQVEGYAINMGN